MEIREKEKGKRIKQLPVTGYRMPGIALKKEPAHSTIVFTFYLLLFTFSFLFSASPTFSQTITATLDRDKIVIGEQVILKIEATKISADKFSLTAWPQLSDTLNHTETVKRGSIDTFLVNGEYTYQQSFTITSFDSGKWQLGPFMLVLNDNKKGKKVQLSSKPVFLSVLPVDISNLKDYHDMKDIIDVEVEYDWRIPAIIAASVLVLVIAIYFIIKKMRKPAAPKEVLLPGTALDRALQELNHLYEEELSTDEEKKSFHIKMDAVIRKYFYEETGMNAMHITTPELMQRLAVYMQETELRKKFQAIMNTNSAVKFAKYFPEKHESIQVLENASAVLKQIDSLIKMAKGNAH